MELTLDTPAATTTSRSTSPAAGAASVVVPPNEPKPLHPPQSHQPLPPTRIPTLSFMYTSEKMSSSTDDSEDLADPLNEELRNVLSVMHVTRENIDALIAKFANFQEPPSMYLEEYQELTSKLHELEIKEQELNEKLLQSSGGAGSGAKVDAGPGEGGTMGGGVLPVVVGVDEVRNIM